MDMEIREETVDDLSEYAQVPIAFPVDRVLEPDQDATGLGGISLTEVQIEPPYVKDYDALPGNHPTDWPDRFDTSGWAMISAWTEGRRLGGIVIAHGSMEVNLLEGRPDLAVLWDVRVSPDARRQGVGSALVRESELWAVSRKCTDLKVETQNINLPACRFYQRQGFVLGAIHRFAYPSLPNEVQLLWYKSLG